MRRIASSVGRLTSVMLFGLAGFMVIGQPASAHVEPGTESGQAGEQTTVGFTPTHGCGESPTTVVTLRLPAEVSDAEPVSIEGWEVGIEERVVIWSGGSLATDERQAFEVAVVLPVVETDTTLYFPTIQTCASGEELAWIQQPGDGTDQSSPAPAIVVSATGEVTEVTVPPTSEPEAPTATSEPATQPPDAADEDSAAEPTTTTTPSTTTPDEVDTDEGEEGDTNTVSPWLAAGILAVAGIIGLLFWLRQRFK